MLHSAHVFDGPILRAFRLLLLRARWKSLIMEKRGRAIHACSNAPSPTLPIAQRLPPEILLLILGYLVDLRRYTQLSCSTDSDSQFKGQSLVTQTAEETTRNQQYLLWATAVCRSWYAVGIELLYAAPFLTTARRVDLFRRTLASPDLARFVKDIYLPVTSHSHTSDTLCWMWGRRSSQAELDVAATLLARLGPAFHALTLRHSVKPDLVSTTPLDVLLLHSAPSGDGGALEHLTVHGSTFETRYHPQFSLIPSLSPDLSGLRSPLANLRTLCLRGLYILPTSSLPWLPRLHTLQLVQNYYFSSVPPDMQSRLVRPDVLPSLRTLELYGEHFCKPETHHGHHHTQTNVLGCVLDPSMFTTLDGFTYVAARGADHGANPHAHSHTHCLSIVHELPTGPDTSVRHLTLGIVGMSELSDLTLPRTLEALTVLVEIPAGSPPTSPTLTGKPGRRSPGSGSASGTPSSNAGADKAIIDAICAFVRKNSAPRSAYGRCAFHLREVLVVCVDRGAGCDVARQLLSHQRQLEELCAERDVVCRVVQQGVDAWIAERLARAQRT